MNEKALGLLILDRRCWRRRRSLRTRLAWKVSHSSPWSFLGSRTDFCARRAVGTVGVCHTRFPIQSIVRLQAAR
jgi:hypothetical protein